MESELRSSDCLHRKKKAKESESRVPSRSGSTKQVRVNTGDSDTSTCSTAAQSDTISEMAVPPPNDLSETNTTTEVSQEASIPIDVDT